MKRFLFSLMSICVLATLGVHAQIITTSPAIVQKSSNPIVLTYHSDKGNLGLKGQSADDPIYAHIGVITNKSNSVSDWKYAPTWGDNSAKYKLEYVSTDVWTLTINSDLRTYFGMTDANETIEKIALVFRNGNKTKEGKDVGGADIFVDVYDDGFQLLFTSDAESDMLSSSTNTVTFSAVTSENAKIEISVDGNSIASQASTTSVVKTYTFTEKGATSIVTARATKGSDIIEKSMTFCYPSESPAKEYPGGVPQMGAVVNADGSVTFCLAAPGKSNAVLVGSWNDYKTLDENVMYYHDYNGNRYFWKTIEGLDLTQDYAYYYAVDQTYKVGDPYAQMILDPYSDKWLNEDLLDDVMPYPYDKVSGNIMLAVLRAPRQYDWKVENFKGVDAKDLIIYELLLRDFTGTEGAAEANGTLKLAMEKLPYLKKLGVNAIELMPIMEFNGNNSWGYNTNFYFATDKAYGSPEDYKAFIDACHENGMAVILDIVFNQTDGLHPWYQLYPIESNPFYNKEAPHAWSVLNDLKQDNPIVQQQWKDVLQYWLKDYKVDGFRFDLVKGLGDNNSYGGGTDGYNQSRVNRMKQLHAYIKEVNPDAYHINELLGDASEDNANAADGQIGWYSQMNGAAGTWAEGSQASLSGFDGYFSGRKSANTIVYAESHDEQRIGYKQNTYGIDGVKDAHDVKMRRLGCVAASMILRPGAHMIWQFGELGNDENTKNDDGSNKTDPKVVRWSDLDDADRKGLYNSYCELNTIRSANPDLFDENATIETAMETSGWSSGYTFHSYTAGGKELIVAINPGSTKMSRVQIAGAQGSGAADYQVISSSYGVNAPTVAMNGSVLYVRNLQPHSYAVVTRNVSTGIDDVVINGQDNVDVIGGQGEIIIAGEYDNVAVFNLAGQPMNSLNVPAGLYIVNVDGYTAKVIVK